MKFIPFSLLVINLAQLLATDDVFIFRGSPVQELETVEDVTSTVQLAADSTSATEPRVRVVYYYAHWCAACHATSKIYLQLQKRIECTESVKLYAFECTHPNTSRNHAGQTNGEFCESQEVKRYPTIKVYWVSDYSSGSNFQSAIMTTKRTSEEMMTWLLDNTSMGPPVPCSAHSVNSSTVPSMTSLTSTTGTFQNIRWINSESMKSENNLHDALQTLGYVLRNWIVSKSSPLTDSAKHAILTTLDLAATLLPGRSTRDSLQNFSSAIRYRDRIQWNEYHQLLDGVTLGGQPVLPATRLPEYVYLKEISGGIWLLFHIMLSSLEAKHSSSNADVFLYNDYVQAHGKPIHSGTVILALEGFVAHFFRCTECQSHFADAVANCEADLCVWVPLSDFESRLPRYSDSYRYGVLWLWRFHNVVTMRTAITAAASSLVPNGPEQSPAHYYGGQDIRFPPESLCPGSRRIFYNKFNKRVSPKGVITPEMIALYQAYNTADETQARNIKERLSTVYDAYEDLRLNRVFECLTSLYWNPKWNDPSIDIIRQGNGYAYV